MKRMFTLLAGLLVCLSAGNVAALGEPEETMTRALNGTTISYLYANGLSFAVRIEEEGISFRRLGDEPRDWSQSYPYQAFEVADDMFMLSWYEDDTGDFVTLVIDFSNDLLYGGAYFAADKSSMLHSATLIEVER